MKYIVEVLENSTRWKDFDTGKLHRLSEPAIEWRSGSKEYFVNGKRHNLNGPAVEEDGGHKEYWIDGVRYIKGQFDIKIESLNKKELTISQIEEQLGYSIKIIK